MSTTDCGKYPVLTLTVTIFVSPGTGAILVRRVVDTF